MTKAMISDEIDWPAEKVSVCAACAKHPELKALVESDLASGVCGVCASSEASVYDPTKFSIARGLIRALIRLHFDEEAYNPHWGGTSVGSILLDGENPILEIAKNTTYADELVERLEWEGEIYPDRSQGIWLYAGHDGDLGRGLQFSIASTAIPELIDIERRLDRENFHAVEGAMIALVSKIEPEIDAGIEEGALWFRGRINVAETALHIGNRQVTRIATPYKGSEIGALPPPKASAGRMNRQGVSVLYLASEVDTALAELRPHPAHLISVGGFRATRRLRIAEFDLPIGRFSSSDRRLDLFGIIYHIDTLLSRPIIPEERYRYAVTQLMADTLVRRGYDGVTYRSSVGTGKNLCVFEPNLFAFDEAVSAVRQVARLDYRFNDIAMSIRTDYTP